MTTRTRPVIEMIACMIAAFVLTTECESYSYMHTIIGLILTLYVAPGIKSRKSKCECLVYCGILSLLIVLTLGKPLDYLRDSYLRENISRDATLSLAWLFSLIAVLIIGKELGKKRQVTYETG